MPSTLWVCTLSQTPAPPHVLSRVLRPLRALRPAHRQLVLRVNRLFESQGVSGLRRAKRLIARYDRAGFDSELQIRYHPSRSQIGRIADFIRYVRQVVEMFGPDRRVLAMTITNEINLSTSPNTSDGAYPHAEQALIQGVIAAHREAVRRGWRRLRFGFTFAYRFNPVTDAAMFRGLRAGGAALRRALGFVGVDYYPQLYPGAGTPISTATLQMMATMRRCFLPLGGLRPRVPLWITEDGYDSTPGVISPERQAQALRQLVQTIHGAARTYGVTDYRWFNLRDNLSSSQNLFLTTGLLTSSYRQKPSFDVYRALVRRFGTAGDAR